jgi:hypothetical protein
VAGVSCVTSETSNKAIPRRASEEGLQKPARGLYKPKAARAQVLALEACGCW